MSRNDMAYRILDTNKCRQAKYKCLNKTCAEIERMSIIDRAGMNKRNSRTKEVLNRMHKI